MAKVTNNWDGKTQKVPKIQTFMAQNKTFSHEKQPKTTVHSEVQLYMIMQNYQSDICIKP